MPAYKEDETRGEEMERLIMCILASNYSLNAAKPSSLPEEKSFSIFEWVPVISAADCLAPSQMVDPGWCGCDRRGGLGRCMSVLVWAHNL